MVDLNYKMKKEDFTLGDMVMKNGKPVGVYVQELEGNCLGVYLNQAGVWKLNLDTQKLEAMDDG